MDELQEVKFFIKDEDGTLIPTELPPMAVGDDGVPIPPIFICDGGNVWHHATEAECRDKLCEHGRGLKEYCEPCGRIHGGG